MCLDYCWTKSTLQRLRNCCRPDNLVISHQDRIANIFKNETSSNMFKYHLKVNSLVLFCHVIIQYERLLNYSYKEVLTTSYQDSRQTVWEKCVKSEDLHYPWPKKWDRRARGQAGHRFRVLPSVCFWPYNSFTFQFIRSLSLVCQRQLQ